MRPKIASALILILVVALLAWPATAKKDPYAMADDAWISISGTIESVSADAFLLDYGEKSVLVEMDDGDRDADGYKLMTGDKVIVSGRIDDDFFETTSIEASSVFVEKLGTYFYASAQDEEDPFVHVWYPVVVSTTAIQGTVTEVNDEEFTIADGGRAITVEVDEMPYNPLDDEGYHKIRVGDRVSVTGDMDYDLFEGHEFEAESVVTLASSK